MPIALGNFLTNTVNPPSHKQTDFHSKASSQPTFALCSHEFSAFEHPSFFTMVEAQDFVTTFKGKDIVTILRLLQNTLKALKVIFNLKSVGC